MSDLKQKIKQDTTKEVSKLKSEQIVKCLSMAGGGGGE